MDGRAMTTPTSEVVRSVAAIVSAASGEKRAGFLGIHHSALAKELHYSVVSEGDRETTSLVVPLDFLVGIEEDFDNASGEVEMTLTFDKVVLNFPSITEAQRIREVLPIANVRDINECSSAQSKPTGSKELNQPQENLTAATGIRYEIQRVEGLSDEGFGTSRSSAPKRGSGGDAGTRGSHIVTDQKKLLEGSAASQSTRTSAAPSLPEGGGETAAAHPSSRFMVEDPEITGLPAPLPPPPPMRRGTPASAISRASGAYAIAGVDSRGDRPDGGNPGADGSVQDDVQASSEAHLIDQELVEAILVGDSHHDPEQFNQPVAVIQATPLEAAVSRRTVLAAALLAILVFVGLIVGLLLAFRAEESDPPLPVPTIAPSMAPTSSPTFRDLPTLDRIKERGELLCGVYVQSAAVFEALYIDASDDVKEDKSVDIIACKAIAAGIFGKTSYRLKVIPLNNADEGREALANREADVVLTNASPSVADDVYDPLTQMGYSMTIPTGFDGLAFGGDPFYTSCADDDLRTFGDCENMRVCALNGTISYDMITSRIPQRNVVAVDSLEQVYGMFAMGGCNVMALLSVALSEAIVRDMLGYTGQYAIGKERFTRTVYSTMTHDADPQWSDFVNMLFMASYAAEQRSILSFNASLMGTTDLFGPQYKDAFSDAISVSGNMGELHQLLNSNYAADVPWNGLNDGSTGLLYAPDFFGVETVGPDPTEGQTLHTILGRGKLLCGVRADRPGFVHLSNGSKESDLEGIDAEYCRAISAAIFDGEANEVEFVLVSNETDGYVHLSEGNIDILAGAEWTLQNDVREPTTGHGFTFSSPYFYAPMDHLNDNRFNDNLCLATTQEDAQWSSFVHWTALSLVLAEQEGITQRYSSQMPELNLFGTNFARMLQDAVHAVGSHGELYDRTLGEFIPRKERNLLNSIQNPAPQRYVLPGFDKLA